MSSYWEFNARLPVRLSQTFSSGNEKCMKIVTLTFWTLCVCGCTFKI